VYGGRPHSSATDKVHGGNVADGSSPPHEGPNNLGLGVALAQGAPVDGYSPVVSADLGIMADVQREIQHLAQYVQQLQRSAHQVNHIYNGITSMLALLKPHTAVDNLTEQ
jgi:hypothetical protein